MTAQTQNDATLWAAVVGIARPVTRCCCWWEKENWIHVHMAQLFTDNSSGDLYVIHKQHIPHYPWADGYVQLWLTKLKICFAAHAEEILGSTGHMILSIELKYFEQAISNITLYMFLGIKLYCTTTYQYREPHLTNVAMHQYRYIQSTHYLVTVALYKTLVFCVRPIHIARSRYSVSFPAQRTERYNFEI
jgi:hypothetical protein